MESCALTVVVVVVVVVLMTLVLMLVVVVVMVMVSNLLWKIGGLVISPNYTKKQNPSV